MSNPLADKIIAFRNQEVEVEGLTFIVRRPTNLEMRDLRSNGLVKDSTVLRDFIIGWKGIKESHLIPGGTPDEVAFDSAVFMAWVADRPDIYETLLDKIVELFKERQIELGRLLKKPEAG